MNFDVSPNCDIKVVKDETEAPGEEVGETGQPGLSSRKTRYRGVNNESNQHSSGTEQRTKAGVMEKDQVGDLE